MMDDEHDLEACAHCGRAVPRGELRNGVCAECIANDY
jgi:NMD protein affecting ribosome stability and mRNA decay